MESRSCWRNILGGRCEHYPVCTSTHEGREDILAWHYDDKDFFSVKSAQRLFCDDNKQTSSQAGVTSTSAGERAANSGLQKIWNLKCRSKTVHLETAHNSLAINCNLARRGVKLDIKCHVCGWLDEDGGHLFQKCTYAKQVWSVERTESWGAEGAASWKRFGIPCGDAHYWAKTADTTEGPAVFKQLVVLKE